MDSDDPSFAELKSILDPFLGHGTPDVKGLAQRSEQGDADASFAMGIIYSLAKQKVSANKYFRIAGEQGSAWGQWFLAESLMSDGLEAEAIWVFEMAARADHQPSMSKLCHIYRDANDAERAKYWCRRAADNGDAATAFELGLMARIAEDWDQAKYWYAIAAEQGDENAMCNLGFV